MALQRSARGKKAKSVFFRQFNDVDIYVEDTSHGTKKLYSVLFERAMEGSCRIETVFPIGNKNTVIAQCTGDQEPGGRPRLYVVDGDLALLTNTNPKGLKRLLVLNRYSIENYVIDEDAIVALLNEEDLEKGEHEVRSAFAFDEWIGAIGGGLFKLFVLYAVASEIVPTFPTVSCPINSLVGSQMGTIDAEKLDRRIGQVTDEIRSVISQTELDSRVEHLVDQANQHSADKLSFVSGKDYLMPLLLMRMRRTCKLRADNCVLKQRLAMKCKVSELAVARQIVS